MDLEIEMERIEKFRKDNPEQYDVISALCMARESTNCHYNDSKFEIATRTIEELEKLGYSITKD